MVASELDALSSKWCTLGKELLHTAFHEDLDSIHTQYAENPKVGLKEMINKRMDYYTTTWMDIVRGLRSSGDPQLADHLDTKYCSSELTVLHSNEMEDKKRLHLK